MTAAEVVVAVDLGGTTIKGAVVDPAGQPVHELARPTPVQQGPEAVLAALEALTCALVSAARSGGAAVRALGVIVPGLVDVEAGRARFSANLGLRDAPVRDRLEAALGLPTVLEHDVRAAGVAERTLGAARGIDDHLVVVIGTGIAAVIHAGGRPVAGTLGIAGELGHLPVWPDGEPCPCGQRGCLERYASASAITRRYAEFGGRDGTSAGDVAARRAADPAAERAWGEATDALAIALVSCTLLLDPALIVLAGGLSGAGEALVTPVQTGLSERVRWRGAPPVRLSPLGARAGLAGAALLAWARAGMAELV